MFNPISVVGSFSVNDVGKAKQFYGETLGLTLKEQMGGLQIELPGGHQAWVYPKKDHQPASFTVLNFIVEDINSAVDDLAAKGISFERYDGFEQDDRAIARGKAKKMGPDIAWFKDPAGNVLAVLEE